MSEKTPVNPCQHWKIWLLAKVGYLSGNKSKMLGNEKGKRKKDTTQNKQKNKKKQLINI